LWRVALLAQLPRSGAAVPFFACMPDMSRLLLLQAFVEGGVVALPQRLRCCASHYTAATAAGAVTKCWQAFAEGGVAGTAAKAALLCFSGHCCFCCCCQVSQAFVEGGVAGTAAKAALLC
jgi:hypothetical protein